LLVVEGSARARVASAARRASGRELGEGKG
jgi:hypothetical protein